MIFVYQCVVGLLFAAAFLPLLAYVLVSGKHRRGLAERLGLYKMVKRDAAKHSRVWLHAASIGEIKVARMVITQLARMLPDAEFVVTTMTIHGRDFARGAFGDSVECRLAPLDVVLITDMVVRRIDPSVYICLETELWPLLIHKIKKHGAVTVLLNARISDKSIDRYRRLSVLFSRVLRNFDRIGAITEIDRDRLLSVGAEPQRVSVTGNIKHDVELPEEVDRTRQHYRSMLGIDAETVVLVAGSTHEPEEELLLPLQRDGESGPDIVWLVAPRHLDRLEGIEELYRAHGVGTDRFSGCENGARPRHRVLLVDTLGDLAELYSVATFAFIGGSLTNYGGHNMMEAAAWGTPVAFGPHTQDFQGAAEDLVKSGGGFRVENIDELAELIDGFLQHPERLEQASRAAERVAASRHGTAAHQVQLVIDAIGKR